MIRCAATLVLGFSLLAAAACSRSPEAASPAAPGETLVIETASGRHPFKVEIAASTEQRETGLMFRTQLAADAGMLFEYQQPEAILMWMRNTLIPLDMVFIGADGRIMNVAERTVPQSLTTIPSAGLAKGVLEVNSGTAAKIGIKPGDRVLHPFFGTAP